VYLMGEGPRGRKSPLQRTIEVSEPFGFVFGEAMACGTPVAALDRGAVREIAEDGITSGISSSLDQR
jgi:glycosyltransferase involved in cell wall biosynthesis